MEYTDPYKNVPAPILTIFGANGNLSLQKLLPSLFSLVETGYLNENTSIVCVTRDAIANKTLLQQLEINILRKEKSCDEEVLTRLGEMITMVQMNLMELSEYHILSKTLDRLDTEKGGSPRNRLFYLAIPPAIFQDAVNRLSESGLNIEKNGAVVRVLVEKPFGTNLESAKSLITFMGEHFREEQIYRIDHYLAKETAQNILTFRTQNPLIEDIWGRQYIDHIQITVAESHGVGWRGNFYEKTGALRDIIQSHMIQLLSLVMMEVPEKMTAESIHTEKQALLESIQIIKDSHVEDYAVRGQYDSYVVDVNNPDSRVETYAAVKLEVTNSRWGGVPILLRTGKGLDKKNTEIHVVFKDRSRRNVNPNILTISIQPNEGISLDLLAKQPGFTDAVQPVKMDFRYAVAFPEKQPDAYERVLMDAMIGDQTLFATSTEVLQSWAIVEPILRVWDALETKPEIYVHGSKGPDSADLLVKEFGSEWL